MKRLPECSPRKEWTSAQYRKERNSAAPAAGFARSGGVAEAVKKRLEEVDPDREVLIERAEGLDNCRKMLMRAKPES